MLVTIAPESSRVLSTLANICHGPFASSFSSQGNKFAGIFGQCFFLFNADVAMCCLWEGKDKEVCLAEQKWIFVTGFHSWGLHFIHSDQTQESMGQIYPLIAGR